MLAIGVGVVLLGGCAGSDRAAVLAVDQVPPPRANLVLGPSAAHGRMAALFVGRSEWPAIERGYRFDDVTFYSRIHYDEQSYYDRFGSLYHESQAVRTGVMVR